MGQYWQYFAGCMQSGGSFLKVLLHHGHTALHWSPPWLHIVLLTYLWTSLHTFLKFQCKVFKSKAVLSETAEKKPQNNRNIKTLQIVLLYRRWQHKVNLLCCILNPKSISKRITIKKKVSLSKEVIFLYQASKHTIDPSLPGDSSNALKLFSIRMVFQRIY